MVSRGATINLRPSSTKVLQQGVLQDRHVLVAPSRTTNENSRSGMGFGVAPSAEKCMCAFDRRQDPFAPRTLGERIQGFVVRRRLVGDAPAFHQIGVLWTDTGIIQAGRHRMS